MKMIPLKNVYEMLEVEFQQHFEKCLSETLSSVDREYCKGKLTAVKLLQEKFEKKFGKL